MKLILKSIDLLFLARPVVLIPVWGFSIFGYWSGLNIGKPFTMRMLWGREYLSAFFYMVIFSMSVGTVYILNQIADYKVDSENEGFPLLVKGNIRIKAALWYSFFLAAVSLAIPFIAGYKMVSMFSGIAILIGLLYCFRPFYFSGRPFTDFLTNAIGFGIIAFGVGWYLVPGSSIEDTFFVKAALPYFLMMCGGSICSTLPDYPGDKAYGKNTTTVVFGITTALIIAIVFDIAAVTYAFFVKDVIAFLCAVVAFPIYILYSMIKSRMLMEATYKVRGGVGMLLAGAVYPVFIPFAAVTFAGTWLYFRLRHNVFYPSLVPIQHETDYS
jgi:4-hydroxybenzoate polyprenyltransferase